MANSEMEMERGRGWGTAWDSTQQNTVNTGQQEAWGKTLSGLAAEERGMQTGSDRW